MFTKTWYTVPKHMGLFTFSCLNCEEFKLYTPIAVRPGYMPDDYKVTLALPSGYYTKMQDIVDAMNSEIEDKLKLHTFPIMDISGKMYMTKLDKDKWPRVKYNDVKKRVHIYLQPGAMINFDEYIWKRSSA